MAMDTLYQEAYCATYGYTSDDCDEIPTMIADSPLITDELIKQFDESANITLLTLSTGSVNNNKSVITFQLTGLDKDYYDLFKTQLSDTSNGLYTPQIQTTAAGDTFVLIETNNTETTDVYNGRLEQWVLNSISIIESNYVTTKSYVADTRKQYEILQATLNELEPVVDDMINVVDTGLDDYTEQESVNTALTALTENATIELCSAVANSTAVRDITETTATVSSAITKNTIEPLSISSTVSKFQEVNDNIVGLIESLATLNTEYVTTQIQKQINTLTETPTDILTSYNDNIMGYVNGFPFTSIDKIKDQIIGEGDGILGGYIGQGKDFITDSKGEVLSTADTLMEDFGIKSAKAVFDKMMSPGDIKGIIAGSGDGAISGIVDDVLTEFGVDDIKSIVTDVKKYTDYIDLSGSGDTAKKYAKQIIDTGIDSTGIKGIMTGIKTQITSMGDVIKDVEAGVKTVTDMTKKFQTLIPTIQGQIKQVVTYAKNVSSFFTGLGKYMSDRTGRIGDGTIKIVDMTSLFKTAADLIAESSGCGGGAKCLIAYGLKGVGLV